MELRMRSTYGSIEIMDVNTSLDIKNTYGYIDAIFNQMPIGDMHLEATYNHIDLSLPKASKASLTLKTPYGEVLTDLPLVVKSKDNGKRPKSTIIAHLNGGGKEIHAEAGYNKIYLREGK